MRACIHGKARRGNKSPEYHSWDNMIQRCTNPKATAYPFYGARGISVCVEWRSSFKQFLADMGPRPEGYRIERRNNDGNYEPSNCLWLSHKDQMRNTRQTAFVFLGNKKMCIKDAATAVGVHPMKIYNLTRGRRMSPQSAFERVLSEMNKPDGVFSNNQVQYGPY